MTHLSTQLSCQLLPKRRLGLLLLALVPAFAAVACENETPGAPLAPPSVPHGPAAMTAPSPGPIAPGEKPTAPGLNPGVAPVGPGPSIDDDEDMTATIELAGDTTTPSTVEPAPDPLPSTTRAPGDPAATRAPLDFAPEAAGGTAVAYRQDGRMQVYATDTAWSLISFRQKLETVANADWSPWQAFDARFAGGKRLAAVNLADARQQVWVVDGAGALRTSWETAIDGPWTAWGTQRSPARVKDVVATGGTEVTTHLFTLGTDNVVRVAAKTGGANSGWGTWTSLGSVTGARALAAVTFQGVHQVFVVAAGGTYTAWKGSGAFNQLQPFETPGMGPKAVTAGTLADGRVFALVADGAGTLHLRVRDAAGTAWSAWTAMPQAAPLRTTGFDSLSVGRLPDGRPQIFGVASDGAVYSLWQSSTGGAPEASFTSRWSRFDK